MSIHEYDTLLSGTRKNKEKMLANAPNVYWNK